MKRVSKLSRPNSHMLLYLALCIILTFLLFGCGSSGGSGSEAAASNETGSIAVRLVFQDNSEETSEFQAVQEAGAEFDCVGNGVGWVEIEVLDENGETLATAGAECEVGEATCTGVTAGDNRKVIAYAKPNQNSEVILYSGETTEPITVTVGETTYTETITLEKLNQPPVSNSGPDQDVDVGDTVTLDGSNSYDNDGNIVSYLWSQISGPAVTLSSPTSATTTFTAPSVTASLTFQLKVTDNDGLQATDTCIVNVAGVAPIAEAGPDQNVDEGDTVTLNGSNSVDPDGNIVSYLWSQISGPTVTLSSPTSVTTTFTAPAVGTGGASLTFQLTVTDNDGLQATDSTTVNVGDLIPPIASAGPDQNVDEGDTVTLDGSNSEDPDGFIVSYLWIQISGPAVTLSSTTAANPTFTAPTVGTGGASLTFQLTVTDNDGLQATDSTTVNVSNVFNAAPVANVVGTPGCAIVSPTLFTLDGSGSSDPDGDDITYSWTLTAPDLSDATNLLDDRTARITTFIALQQGTYIAELVVSDGEDDSEPATVKIILGTLGLSDFDFASDAQGWTVAGPYDGGTGDEIDGWFFIDDNIWDDSGVIFMGIAKQTTLPTSPSGNPFVYWQFNSSDLSLNCNWQGISGISFDISGELINAKWPIYVQVLFEVQRPDGTTTFYIEEVSPGVSRFEEIIRLGFRQSFEWDASSIPNEYTLRRVILRIFFETSEIGWYDGFVLVDNVSPR